DWWELGIPTNFQATSLRRRRAKTRRAPQAATKPGNPAPTMGPGTAVPYGTELLICVAVSNCYRARPESIELEGIREKERSFIADRSVWPSTRRQHVVYGLRRSARKIPERERLAAAVDRQRVK